MPARKSRNLLYASIVKDIKDKIEAGIYKEGDTLPTEQSLCEQYKVSRVTIRRALDEMLEAGVLTRDFGKSAMVSPRRFPREVNRLNGLFEELEGKGIKCSSYILGHKVTAADEKLGKLMKCRVGEDVLLLERIRYADGVPLCYQRMYLLNKYGENLDIAQLTHASLYRMLEDKCALSMSYATQSISAEMSSFRVSALLEQEGQNPVLKVLRQAYTEKDECFEYSETYYNSQLYHLSMTLRR